MVKESSDDGNTWTNRYEQTDFGLFVFASSDTGVATEPVRFTPGLRTSPRSTRRRSSR